MDEGQSPGARTTRALQAMLRDYGRTREPIATDFRKLVAWLPDGPRAVHYLHPYPAKLLMHIPHFFIENELLSAPGDVVWDPFCGSGTVLVEAMLSGRRSAGCDINPLARLLASVKTRPLHMGSLQAATERLHDRIDTGPTGKRPEVVNLDYWYYPSVARDLTRLRHAIARTTNAQHREFFEVCFSACARKVSRADPRISVPVRLRQNPYDSRHWLHSQTNVWIKRRTKVVPEFEKTVTAALSRLKNLSERDIAFPGRAFEADVRDPKSVFCQSGIRRGSISLIVTSPPYPGAQKYIRASSLNLGWLGYGAETRLRHYERRSVGREKYPVAEFKEPMATGIRAADRIISDVRKVDALRAHIAAVYLCELRSALETMRDALKPSGHLVLVVGDNELCTRPFETHAYVMEMATQVGFATLLLAVDPIRGRGLMTRRNNSSHPIAKEWVMLFRRTP